MESRLQSHIGEGHINRSFFHGRTINAVYMIGMIAMTGAIGHVEAYRRAYQGYRGLYRTYRADMWTRLCMTMHMCRPSQFLCTHMCTYAQNGFADSRIQTACTLFHVHSFTDTDEMRFQRCRSSLREHIICLNLHIYLYGDVIVQKITMR
jgi:hypothetical protein